MRPRLLQILRHRELSGGISPVNASKNQRKARGFPDSVDADGRAHLAGYALGISAVGPAYPFRCVRLLAPQPVSPSCLYCLHIFTSFGQHQDNPEIRALLLSDVE